MAIIPPGADPSRVHTAVLPSETPEAIEGALAATKPRSLLRRIPGLALRGFPRHGSVSNEFQ